MRSVVRVFLLPILLSLCGVSVAPAQLRFSASQPNVDSFPTVRIGVGVTYDGIAATDLDPADFRLLSDGALVSNLELVDCDVPVTAAIAIVVDTSASMKQSVGTGTAPNFYYGAFRSSFSELISRVPPGSYFTVIPFGDSATYSYPRTSPYFYRSAVDADTAELLRSLQSLNFDSAGTFVDAGIAYATDRLRQANLSRRVIILITDDYIDEEPAITALLQSNSISLYVMQVRPDSGIVILPNREVARATAGDYLEARDSSSYAPIMAEIASEIFSTHCTLRYADRSSCPWMKQHDLNLTLNYQSHTESVKLRYGLGPNTLDRSDPLLATDSALAFERIVVANKDYPCLAALKSAKASFLSNFRSGQLTVHPDSLWLPLFVLDSLYAADGEVTVSDVNGNESTTPVHYSPRPDTLGPQFGSADISSGACQISVREALPWDRGLESVTLDPAAINLVVDQIKFYRKDSASITAHVHDLTQAVDGCLIAVDSAGNRSRLCLTFNPAAPDVLPPILTQDPLGEPRKSLSGTVTEHRPNDSGLKDILVAAGANAGNGSIIKLSSRGYQVRALLQDSMYRSVVYVRATDSAGNEMYDSLVYVPEADILAPDIQSATSGSLLDVLVTETLPWDRGLKMVSLASMPTNAQIISSGFADSRHWSAALRVLDTTLNASITITATDSANNSINRSIAVLARPKQTIDYMGDLVVDFGTHFLPIAMQKRIVIQNTNAFSVTVTVSSPTGDDSVFALVDPNSFPLGAHNAEELTFSWFPHSAGHWKAVYTLYSGTEKIGTITLIGVSIAKLILAADTVGAYAGVSGKELHVRLETDPTPLNIDTIVFRMNFNGDVVEFGDPDCAGALCDYTTSISRSPNALTVSLTRPPHGPAVTLDLPTAILTFPIRTFVSAQDSTPVWFSNVYSEAGYAGDTLNGLVYVIDTCGTPDMRRVVSGQSIADILSISPDPAGNETSITVSSRTVDVANVVWLDVLGRAILSSPLPMKSGVNSYRVETPETSGSYIVRLTLPGIASISRRVLVVR